MDDREWMYSGRRRSREITREWVDKTEAFIKQAFDQAPGARAVFCPCTNCNNRKRQTKEGMTSHLARNGFMKNYTQWTHHGEADREREEVVRPRVEDYNADADAGVAAWLDDYNAAHFAEGLREGEGEEAEPEESAKAYYNMLSAAGKPLHGHTQVSKLDGISRLMALKSQFNLSRENFDEMLTVIGSILPAGHLLPQNMYESQKVLRALKMSYEQIHACLKGCILFRKAHKDAQYCPKCKSSRYLEVDSGEGEKRQSSYPAKILRYLPFIPRIQRLFMTEESAKQMTWHKNGKKIQY